MTKEVNDDHQDPGHSRGPQQSHRQVRLSSPRSGRSSNDERPLRPSYRLKPSVECFVADTGEAYLLRLGSGDDLALGEITQAELRTLVALSERRCSAAELEELLEVDRGSARHFLDQLSAAAVLEVDDQPSRLSADLRARYDRQLNYFLDLADSRAAAEEMQLRLSRSTVVLVGVGGLGAWVAAALAGAGVGSLVLVDDDCVELTNLNRQLLYTEAQLGELKVEAARASLLAHNRGLDIRAVVRRIESPEDLGDLLADQPSLVVATADWPPHQLPRWVNQACVEAGVPWIGAGQFPPRLRIGPLVVPGRSACWACLEEEVRAEAPLYDQIAAWRSRRRGVDSSVGPVSGVIGTLLASEALHLLVGAFPPASLGRAISIDLSNLAIEIESVERRPTCPVCAAAS